MAKKVNGNGNATNNTTKGGKKMTKAERIAKKIADVAKITFTKNYKRIAMLFRASKDMSLKFDEVVCMQNSRENNGIKFTLDHTGKMLGMFSLNTVCLFNKRCIARINAKPKNGKKIICAKCFANRMFKFMKSMIPAFKQNLDILTTEIIAEEDLPIINACWFRIESFGDLANVTQAINYMNLIRKNPQTFFAWFSKNMDIVDEMFKVTGYEKPVNVNFIQSSLYENEEEQPMYWFVDKVFTVYDSEYIKENEVEINCGARSCLKCRLCYGKNDIVYVREEEK